MLLQAKLIDQQKHNHKLDSKLKKVTGAYKDLKSKYENLKGKDKRVLDAYKQMRLF